MSNTSALSDVRCFDPHQDYSVAWKRLPHWAQAGTACFITWRTADSLPEEAITRLDQQRQELLREQQLDPSGDWKQALAKLPPTVRARIHWLLFTAWDEQLDSAAGACVLREPALCKIVMKSLKHFDNDRYVLTDAVVMPNHVHALVAFRDEGMLLTQCTSWKHYTATEINKWLRANCGVEEELSRGATELRSPVAPRLGSPQLGVPPPSGEFWQVEQFDHLVRSPEDFEKYRRYIAENPVKAGLPEGSFRYYSKASSEESQSRRACE